METPELVGRFVVVDGSMKWVDGPLTVAMKEGHWFLLNEFDYLDPATAAGLNSILEGNPLEIPETGEMVHAHENFRFIATANTNGAGDQTGLYSGTLRQNIAAMDRFFITQVDYPTVEQETQILAATAAALPEDIRSSMIKVANDIRALFLAGGTDVTLSIRTLCRWATYAMLFQDMAAKGGDPIRYSFDRALGFRTDTESRKALHEILQRTFGNSN
jgi:cobaltochelatase CobS